MKHLIFSFFKKKYYPTLLLFNFSYTFYLCTNFIPYFRSTACVYSIFVNPLVRRSASTKSTSIFGHERYRSQLRDWHRCHPRSLARNGNIHGRALACLTLLLAHRSQDFSPRATKGGLPPARTKYLRETKFSVIREETGPFDLPSVTVEHRERAKRLPLPPIDPNNCTASRNFHNAMERLPCFAFTAGSQFATNLANRPDPRVPRTKSITDKRLSLLRLFDQVAFFIEFFNCSQGRIRYYRLIK